MKRSLLVLLVLLVCLASMGFASADSAATLTAQAAPVQPFNLPIIVHLSLTNTGQEPFSYDTSGPGQYPIAETFYATIKSMSGTVYRTSVLAARWSYPYSASNMPPHNIVAIFNGQSWGEVITVDLIHVSIKPGEMVDVPIALSPMPLGQYVITFGTDKGVVLPGERWPGAVAKSITVTVVDDSALATSDANSLWKQADSLWRQADASEPFAHSVCSYFHIPCLKAVATKPK